MVRNIAPYSCKSDHIRKGEGTMARHVFLEGLWKKRRISILCLALVLLTILAYFHRPLIDRSHLTIRRFQIGRILTRYWSVGNSDYSKRNFHARGPLTVDQVETELFGKPLDSGDTSGTNKSTELDKAWTRIKSNFKTGDELYFFTSDKLSWQRLMGQRGYVVIRGTEVVNVLVTFMN